MKLSSLRFLPKVIERKALYFGIGLLFGIPIYLVAGYFDPIGSYSKDFSLALTGGIITIALLIASLLQFIPSLKEKKESFIPILYPVALIIFSVLISAVSNIVNNLIYFALYYLVLGIIFFLNEIREIVSEHTIGATLLDKVTYESRKQKLPLLGEESIIAHKTFEGNIRINKGDSLLAKCAFMHDGRLLVQKIINNANYVIYITADRPHTMVMQEFKEYQKKLYCIDCFTNVYGFGEFKEASGEFNSYTLKPTTVKELHERLREVRKQVIAAMYFEKNWLSLNKEEIKRVTAELASKDATLEREKNIWIIYDSISSLAAIFDLEPLLKFLIHDTTVDTLIGRNTLLLMKGGALGQNEVGRLESFCEHIFNIKVEDNKLCINIDRSDDIKASHFCINI